MSLYVFIIIMKHIILYLLSIFLCCACCEKTSTRSIPDTDFSRKDFRQSISLSDPDTVIIDDALNPLDFYLVKDSMVLIENADDSQTYKAGIYQLKTGRLIREFARKGEGPEEFVSCQLDVRSNLSDSFYLDDFMQNRYWECNLDSLIFGSRYLQDHFIYSRDVIRLCPLNNIYIGYNFWFIDEACFDNGISSPLGKYEKKTQPSGRQSTGHPYFVANVTGGFVFCSPDKKQIWVADFYDSRIHIYNDSLQEIKCLHGPDNFKRTFNASPDKEYNHFVSFDRGTSFRGYVAYTTTDKHVYLVYEGTNGTPYRVHDLKPVEVFKLDWEGNLLLRYQLDRYIRTVSIDSQERHLYATSYSSHGDPTVFIKYTLK